jgi:hypothetical protein
MAYKRSVLVVANRTAASDELLEALRARAQEGPIAYTLVVPPTTAGPAARDAAQAKLETLLQRAKEAGLELTGRLGPPDPLDAVAAVWDPRAFDEVIVSTLPGQASKWMLMDLPHRVARFTGVLVTHVVASDERVKPIVDTVPPREKRGVLSPLTVLSWGGKPPAGERERAPEDEPA